MSKVDDGGTWGRAYQKMLLVRKNHFDELKKYLQDGWIIESISACGKVFNAFCYVVLTK